MQITQFIIENNKQSLTIQASDKRRFSLTGEFLRVLAPAVASNKNPQPVSNKKLTKIMAIESVGKHGFRLLFDDGFSDIYSPQYLVNLGVNMDSHWQQYLDALATHKLTREATIAIKSL